LTPGRPIIRQHPPAEGTAGCSNHRLEYHVPRAYPDEDRQTAETAEQIEAAFREHLHLSGLRGEWRMASAPLSETVVRQARQADLTILGQLDPDRAPPPAGRQLIEDVLMTAGRPILLIPYAGRAETCGTNILVG